MNVTPDIEVLLATFNGERFLREQLDSILAQDYKNLRVIASDDGSTDGTLDILLEYGERFPERVQVLRDGASSGTAKGNFLRLMLASSAPFVCFSDQDDLWLPDKVSVTYGAMQQLTLKWGMDVPLLVFTDLRVVDEELRTLQHSFWAYEKLRAHRVERLGALLAQNVVTGCTCMLNRQLVELALSMPEEAVMHDHWVALLASGTGKAAAIETQTVLYRQHCNNVIGSEQWTGTLSEFATRVRKSDVRRMEWKKCQRQAAAFLRMHGSLLSDEKRREVNTFLRCGTAVSPLVRSWILLRHGLLRDGLLQKLATLADQWTTRAH